MRQTIVAWMIPRGMKVSEAVGPMRVSLMARSELTVNRDCAQDEAASSGGGLRPGSSAERG